jgi:hypothetical protein
MPGDGFILIFWSWLFGLIATVWFNSLSVRQSWRKLLSIAVIIFVGGIAAYFSMASWDEDYEWANQIRSIAIVAGHIGLGGLVGTAIGNLTNYFRQK